MPEIANNSVFSQTDASNTGTLPGISGSSAPSQIDDSIRALIGSVKREHDWRNFTITTTGSANAYVATYSVAPAAYYTGQRFGVITNFAVTGSATINVNSLGAKTIKKLVSGVKTNLASGDVSSGDYLELIYDGTDMVWMNKGIASVSAASDTASGIVELATTTEQLTGTDATRASTPDSIAALWEQGADVASAGTVSLGEGGYFNITGTTTITDIDFATDKAGRKAWVKFAGVLTLTHNASTLILPGGASITTAAGDTACFVSEGSDVVRCVAYNKASGQAVVTPASGPTRVYKTADESVTSSTAVQDDDHLTFAVAANTKYAVKLMLTCSHATGANGGMQAQFTGPASPTRVQLSSINYGGVSTITTATISAFSSTVTVIASGSGATTTDVIIEGIIQNGANAGTVLFRWAQNGSNATPTVIYAGSYLEYQVVS